MPAEFAKATGTPSLFASSIWALDTFAQDGIFVCDVVCDSTVAQPMLQTRAKMVNVLLRDVFTRRQ